MRKVLLFIFITSIVALAQTAPPANLTATVTGTTYKAVSLNWQYDTTITNIKYNVYKKTGLLADTSFRFYRVAYGLTKRQYVDNNVSVGKKYSYYVTAVKTNIESAASNKIEVEIPAPPPPAFGKISGKISEDGTGLPVFRANVQIFTSGPSPTPNAGSFVSVMTDSNGKFTAKLKVGTYYIWTGAFGYVAEYYDNVPTKSLATAVTVAENDSLIYNIGIAKIVPPVLYNVSGAVVNESGAPLKAEITAYSTRFRGPSCSSQYHTRTDSLGNYTLKIKENDTIVVFASPNDRALKPQYYNNKETFATADLVVVAANVSGINFIIHPKPVYANGVEGFVKDSAGTVGLKGMVYIYRKSINNLSFKKGVRTDSLTGGYAFANLEPGLYILSAQAPGYKPTYFTYSGTPTLNWRQADSVVVTATGIVTGINFNLRVNNHLHGHGVVYGFVKESNAVVDGAINYIVDETGNFVDYSVSDVDGSYYISTVGTGSFTLVSSLINNNDTRLPVIFEETGTLTANVDVNLTPSNVTGINDNNIIEGYALDQNYPNPFNPTTMISYQIPQNTVVTLKLYNVLGKEVATLVNEQQTAGQHFITFNASNLASGVYLYKIQAGNFSSVKKLTLIK